MGLSRLLAVADAGLIQTLTAVPAHVPVRKSMRAQQHTGLIVLSLAPRPHYPYNCMSGTFSSAVQPKLHNADKHPSHVNSPSGPLFGQDGDVITRIPTGNKILFVMWNWFLLTSSTKTF